VVGWAGLDSTDPRVMFEGEPENLTTLNDDQGLTFPEIATLIEEQL